MMNETIIERRDLKPLMEKAREILWVYQKAVSLPALVVDPAGEAIKGPQDEFHQLCNLCEKRLGKDSPYKVCPALHRNELKRRLENNEHHIYTCPMGLVFWTSALVRHGLPSGIIIAGGILNSETLDPAGTIARVSNGSISEAEAAEALRNIPVRSSAEIDALARIENVCAEVSSSPAVSSGETRLPGLDNAQATIYNPDASIDLERELIAALNRGDMNIAKTIVGEFLVSLSNYSSESGLDFSFMQSRAIEMAALLSRTAAENVEEGEPSFDGAEQYMARIEETTNAKELSDCLIGIIENLSINLFSFKGVRHAGALRKAERYIWENYTRKVTLEEIAAAAGLSGPYFSLVFKRERGENLSTYLNRLRIEKASALLRDGNLSLQEIAEICGFEDQSWFSKIFKKFVGMTPGKFRNGGNDA